MSNDVPTPKMLLSVFTDTINYLIENHKYQEAYEKSLFSLDRIIIDNHFGVHFRKHNCTKRRNNKDLWDNCKQSLSRYKLSIKEKITKAGYCPTHETSATSPNIMMPATKRLRTEMDDSVADLAEFGFTPSIFKSPAPNRNEQVTFQSSTFKSPAPNGNEQFTFQSPTFKSPAPTNLFGISEPASQMIVNNATMNSHIDTLYGVYVKFFESGKEHQDCKKLCRMITGNDDVDALINMDHEDINDLGIDMNRCKAKKGQKAFKLASKFKSSFEAIETFVDGMESDWYRMTQLRNRTEKMECDSRIRQYEEEIKKEEEKKQHIDNIEKYGKSLRDLLLEQQRKTKNINDTIIELENGRLTPDHRMDES